MTKGNQYSTGQADEVRRAAYRVAATVRQIEDLAKIDTVSVTAWEDLRWATDRLTVLVAAYKPADTEGAP